MPNRYSVLAGVLIGLVVAFLPVPGSGENLIERLVSPGDLIKGHAKAEKNCSNCHKSFTKAAQDALCLACHKDIAADLRAGKGLHGKRKSPEGTPCKHCHTDHKGRDADIINFDKSAFDHTLTDFALTGAHKTVPCEQCHAPHSKFSAAPNNCFDCHKGADRHGGQLGPKCESCHKDASWKEPKPFDHGQTQFVLTGAHVNVTCAACHAGERYKGTPAACAECHRKDDVHKGAYGNKCDGCHKTPAWREIGFDHDRDTKFPLMAKHAGVACGKCHKGDPAKNKTPIDCLSCHQKEDVHKGRLGKQCQDCHNESGWKIGVLFEHDKTKFALRGKHAEIKCSECHKEKIYEPVETACLSCHAKKDVHAGRLGPKCEQCHNASNWKEWHFDHATEGRYPLTGTHAKIGCYDCHSEKSVRTAVLPRECLSCHKKQDRHRGAFGKDCGKCHSAEKFAPAFIAK